MWMQVPGGRIELLRIPHVPRAPLRAWDAADAYVLEYLGEGTDHPGNDRRRSWLLVNDRFGALAVARVGNRPTSWGDSVTSHEATQANLVRNGHHRDAVRLLPADADPEGFFDVVVIKVPRSLALLEDQLHRLRPHLHRDSVVVGAGMLNHINRSSLGLFEQIIGPAPTSRAKRKARLIWATVDPGLEPGPNPYPSRYRLDDGSELIEHANVFSRGRLDGGARILLAHLPALAPGARVLDLGCGNGVLGLHAARQSPVASVTFVDESYQAVASARANADAWADEAAAAGVGWPKTQVVAARNLDQFETGSFDVVLNNPPFHSHDSRIDTIAKEMFADAHRVLAPGGQMIVVGNRHLAYHQLLHRRFGKPTVLGSNPKFVVLWAQRTADTRPQSFR